MLNKISLGSRLSFLLIRAAARPSPLLLSGGCNPKNEADFFEEGNLSTVPISKSNPTPALIIVSVVLSLLDEIDNFALAIRVSAFSLLTKGILTSDVTQILLIIVLDG